VMAQAPQPVPAPTDRPTTSPLRQVQATPQDLQGPGAAAAAPLAPVPAMPGLTDGPIGDGPVVPTEPRYPAQSCWRVWANGDYLLWRTSKPAAPAVASVV